MIRNYLKIAWRNIRKQKFYAILNILGLTIGMTCCFLIFMYVRFELSYDTFHKQGDHIYRVVTDVKTPTELIESGITSMPMGPNINADFPEVKACVRILQDDMLVLAGENKYHESKVLVADSGFFSMFSFPLIRGDIKRVLAEPFSLVLSESKAKKYFGNADPIGKTLEVEGKKYTMKVTGIMKDIPENSHLPFDMVVSMTTASKGLGVDLENSWGNFGAMTYLLLEPGADATKLERKLPDFMERHVGKMMKTSNMYYTLHLERLKDVYMTSKKTAPVKGSVTNVYIFSFIALFIMLIAVINFVNLATARATERAREVGVRKAVGAYEGQLTLQFLCETLVLALVAFVLSLVLCQLLLPAFNMLSGKEIARYIFANAAVIWFFLIAVATGLLAGIYPAVVLSSYKPVVVLKGAFSSSTKGLFLRQGLVILQFAITIILIAGVLIVYHQLTYMQEKDLGFKKEQQLVIELRGIEKKEDKWVNIKQEILQMPGVTGVTLSSSIPSREHSSAYSKMEMKSGEMQASNIDVYFVDFDFIKQYGIKVIAGRDISGQMGTDSTRAMLVNEATVKSLGYSKPEDIVGKRFSQWGRDGKVVGVVKNFNYHSLRDDIHPLTIRFEPGSFELVTIGVRPEQAKKVVAGVESLYNRYAPDGRFEYFFVDDAFNRQYGNEERFGRLVLTATLLAISLAVLGLLGLISYIVIQRTKEIGIRKVLGASVGSILFLLSKDFLKLVLIALLIAMPLSWYLMYQWLQEFAYRINIHWSVFLLAGALALIIAFLAMSLQTVRAALSNPVRSLRTE
ncbi:ABC transporter permease [Chitinophaga tropicalis]|uniref:FtsX-like permease family protein n=1 Tax=Chitinophaga tropicalis TaxID=2683588 RepID=A0A7K1TZ14_9BACT|nr:ABC transporter permease [Chitinophaga tropicalis]MVT07332.1 FtsX-like permease family protein [Chitinophaga tropicalis]